jgi:hypothetical protein
MRTHAYALALFGSMTVAACTPRSDESRWDTKPEDVQVVTNDRRAKAPTMLQLAPQPTLRVGGPAAVPEDELEPNNGVLAAALLSDGGIVVTEETRIHVFDASGFRRAVLGRRGSGPEEFQNIHAVCRTRGDTVVAEDFNNGRIVVVDARTATLVRTFPNTLGHMTTQACLGDGTFVVQGEEFDKATGDRTMAYRRLRLDGTQVATLLTTHQTRSRRREVGLPRHAASADKWHYADAYFSEFRSFDTAGRLLRIVRSDEPLREVSKLEALASQGMEAAKVSTVPNTGNEMVRSPFYGKVLADSDGRVWIGDIATPENAFEVWTAFDSIGRSEAQLRIPNPRVGQQFEVIGFVPGGVLIRRNDESGAAYIEHYQVVPLKEQ